MTCSSRNLSFGLNCRLPRRESDQSKADTPSHNPCPPPPFSIPLSFLMSSLSPPPMRNRASSTNLRPALTISTLGPRPKACALMDSIPATPQATADLRKVAPSLASPSRLSTLLERCVDLLHVYSYFPPYSSPSTPVSSSDDSVLPMSTTTTYGDDVGEKQSIFLEGVNTSPSRPWFRNMPSVCLSLFIPHASAQPSHHRLMPPSYL